MRKNEPIATIMSTELVTAHVGQKLSEVRALLSQGHIHHIPVLSGERLVGLISSADILKAGYGGSDSEIDSTLDFTAKLEDVMQNNPTTISAQSTVRDAAEILAEGSFHCLPVVKDEKLVGIVTTTDLLRYLVAQY
ncbi:MAG: CBS domain-containing protein [Bdellovibrionales bacterium]|nr:CBS domain-containing protein [Bdellovibrionales bacterium]